MKSHTLCLQGLCTSALEFFPKNNLSGFNETKGCNQCHFAAKQFDWLHIFTSSVQSKRSARCGQLEKGQRASAGPGSMLLQGYHDGAPGNRTCRLPDGEGKPRFVPRQMKIQITRLKLHAQNNTLKCGGVHDLHAFQSASAIPRALRKHGRWSVIDDEKNCLTVSLLFQPSLLSLLVCKGSGMSAVGYYGPFLHVPMQ